MEFDLGKKGTLKVLFYKECKETDFKGDRVQETSTGELRCELNGEVTSVTHKELVPGRFLGEITRKWFETAFPQQDFGQFNRTSSGQLRVLVGHITSGDLYETDVRDTDGDLKRHIDCLARVARGDKKLTKTLHF